MVLGIVFYLCNENYEVTAVAEDPKFAVLASVCFLSMWTTFY
jgi:hypothetical protein